MIFFNYTKTKDNPNTPNVYVENVKYDDFKILSDCEKEEIDLDNKKIYLFKCSLNSNEIEYFNENDGLIWNSFLCGNQKHFTKLKVYKLDKKKYPVFKIKKCICPKKCTCEKDKNCECKIEVKVEGTKPDVGNNIFGILVDLDGKVKQMNCSTSTSSCKMEYEDSLEKLKLLPYYWIIDFNYPFEVIINYSYKLNFNLIFFLLIVLMIH